MLSGGESSDMEDFSRENIGPEVKPYVPTQKYDPERSREWVRAGIAILAILLFAVTVALSFYALILTQRTASDIKEFLTVVLPAVSAVVSGVLGFYYGSAKARD